MCLLMLRKQSSCFVPGCTTGYKSCKKELSLFGVPKDESTFAQWQRAKKYLKLRHVKVKKKTGADATPFENSSDTITTRAYFFTCSRSTHKVACWNAPKGCSFIGTAASLLDHYKECGFSIVPCCLCRSLVLQCDILEHFKSGCSIREAMCEPPDNLATEDLKDVGSACLEMKRATGKISEDLMLLQTSLNRCSNDVRAEGARCKGQLEAEAQQLNSLNVVCTTGFAKELQVLQPAMTDYKYDVSKELRLLSCCKPVRVHWYIAGWADLKKKALEVALRSLNSLTTWAIYGYSVSLVFKLYIKESNGWIVCFMRIHLGEQDLQLEWPFRKVYRAGVIHPKDQSNEISRMVNPGNGEDECQQCFLRPKEKPNVACGADLATAEKLETGGFIQNNTLHMFLEVEP
ncbi:uncharacterized protein LOC120844606 [Ixodes scapularis]|uniref:uncharacterized protein LOC120844606 n=1 Tax=Ixodes scapularis TaxID=6945 RepID=UPI001A9E8834|nr:uncharacterized protein LOC120844606 [Ixodes scapularis]